jgi:membrane-bound lytic murein transglycosylase A
MVQQGRMRQEEVSMASLKGYLRDHPSERDVVLQANERYIYFQRLDNPPVGSLGVPLTDGRSVAADPAHYPPGTLLFINPIGADASAGRLVFVQDRGSAITGKERLDLFVGTGDDAGRIAGAMRQQVEIYVLRAR